MHAQVADTLEVLDWLHGAQRKQMHAQRASMWVAVQKMAPDAAYLASSASSGECLSHITSVSNCLCQGTSLLLAATPRSMAAGSSIAQHLGSIPSKKTLKPRELEMGSPLHALSNACSCLPASVQGLMRGCSRLVP